MSDYDGKQSPPKDFSASFELASPASYEKGEIAPQSKRERLWQHLCDDVRTKHVDYVVLLCWFVTGLLDGTIFNGTILASSHCESTTHQVRLTMFRSISYICVDADW